MNISDIVLTQLQALPDNLKIEGFELLAEAFCRAESLEELELFSRVSLQTIVRKGGVQRG